MKLRVAALQMPVDDHNIAANESHIVAAIDEAALAGAEILLTPEGALSGYHPAFDPAALQRSLQSVVEHAQRAGLGLALGTCNWEADGKCYNQLRFYRSDGAFLGFHAKTLLCAGIRQPRASDELNHFSSKALEVFNWSPGLRLGGLICNDMWANPEYTPMPDPHLAQQLGNRGVQVIFHAVNGGRDGSETSRINWNYHEANLLMRARAAGVWIVTVDNARPVSLDCSSPGGVVTPEGAWAARVPARGPQLLVHTIELA